MPTSKQIDPGTIVRLKSGGPEMTTGIHEDNGLVFCYWFHEHELRTAKFRPEALEIIKE